MTTTVEKPTALQCACPNCNCKVHADTAFGSGTLLFCSDGCGCECHG